MSEADDTKVVNLQINNKQFLKGTGDSLKALDTLNKGIDNASKGKGMQDMSKSVDVVKTKFGALQVAGVTALATITNKAVNAGLNLVKSLTISPVLSGFREYEKLLTSTQTILANTGKEFENFSRPERIQIVGNALDELNHYADQTVYNFGQMADNIGRFTAAGVGLQDSVSAIKGLSNAAALSGSTTEQLNTAMYQVSQALSTGTIKLMDWNSLANAGLGGSNIREALMATARTIGDHGKAMDAAIKKNGNFRDSLRDGWLEAGVFNKTMKVFAGQGLSSIPVKQLKKEGFDPLTISMIKAGGQVKFTAKDLEILNKKGFNETQIAALQAGDTIAYTVKQLQDMGYSKQAAKDLARLSQDAIDSATKIKTFSQLMDVTKESIESGWAGVFRQIFGDLEESGELWTSVGNKITGAIDSIFRSMTSILVVWHDMETVIDGKSLNGYQLAWGALGNVFQIVGNILSPFLKLFSALAPNTDSAGKGLFGVSKTLYLVTDAVEKATRGLDFLNPVFETLGNVVGAVVGAIGDLLSLFKPLGSAVVDLVTSLDDVGSKLGGFDKLSSGIATVFETFNQARLAVLEPFVVAMTKVVDSVKAFLSGDIDPKAFGEAIRSAFSNLGSDLLGLFQTGKAAAADIIAGLREGISGGGGDIKASIQGFVNGFVDFFKGLLGIHSPSTVFEGFGGDIVQGLVNGIKGAIGLIGDALSAIGDGLSGIDKFDIANIVSIIFGAGTIFAITRFMKTIGGAFTTFAGFAEEFRTNLADAMTGITAAAGKKAQADLILSLGIAIGLLAASLFLLSKIPYERLAVGVGVIGLMMRQLQVVMASMAKSAPTTKTAIASVTAMAVAMGLMAGAILILSAAVLAFGLIPTNVLVKGMIAVGVALALLSGMAFVLGKASPWLIAAGAATLLMSTALLVLSVALVGMAGAIALYDKMDWSTILGGLAKMGVVLIALGVAMIPLALLAPGVLIASAALVILGVGLTAMLGVLLAFAAVDGGTIAKGIALVAAALVAIGIASLVAAPGIALLGAGVLVLGVGLLAAGAGMTLLAAAVTVLVAAGAAGTAVLIAGIEAFISVLPLMGIQFIAAIDAILGALAEKSPSIRNSLVTIGTEFLRGLRELSGPLAQTALELLTKFVAVVLGARLILANAGIALILTLIAVLASRSGEIIQAGGDLIMKFLSGIGAKVSEMAVEAAKALIAFLDALDAAIDTYLPRIIESGGKIAGSIVEGVAKGLLPDAAVTAIKGMVDGMVNGFKSLLGINSPSTVFAGFGGDIIRGLVKGITGLIGLATGAISGLVSKVINGVSKMPGRIKGALSGLAGAFSSAFNAAKKAVEDAVTNIGRAVGQLPGKVSAVVGKLGSAAKSVGSSIIKGIGKGIGSAGSFTRDLAGDLKRAINNGLGLPKRIGFSKTILGKKVSASITIPGFARGVTGFGGGAALVGEKGPEIVTMGRGSNVITNENLVKFMKTVSSLTKSIVNSRGPGSADSSGGTIVYSVSAGFSGNPKARGTEFAANIAAGLINGLKSSQPGINSAMSGAASEMSQSFADILGIRSPSVVFKKYAGYVGQGFINGLLASVAGVQKAAKIMATSAIDTVSKTISDGQLKLEAQSGKADAYSAAAALVRKKASKTKSKSEKKRLEKEAKALESKAKAAQKEADAQQKKVDAENAAKERAAAYEKADTQGKADMKNEDAEASAKSASATREAAIRLSKEADLVRKYDKKRAKALDAEAKKQLERSKIFAARAATQAQQAADLTAKAKAEVEGLEKAAQDAQIQSVSSDQVAAAQAQFDSYAKQLQEALEAAGSQEPTVVNNNLTQNNTSPEAIPPGEAYRNGKSLLSSMERKLTPTP